MNGRLLLILALMAGATACAPKHRAPIRSAELPPPPDAAVLHSGRLWIELRGYTADEQCVAAEEMRPVCFTGVQDALAGALVQTLWPSFPEVRVKGRADDLEPGDYLLLVQVELEPLAPGEEGPGWAAGLRGRWRLVRDGLPVTGEGISSRSRFDFAYGRPLGVAAGEVLDAAAVHVARTVGQWPETQPRQPVPLPQVAARTADERSRPLADVR